MKYSLVMPYIDRLEVFKRTCESLLFHYADRKDFEIILVEDSKNDDDIVDVLCDYADKLTIVHVPCVNPGFNPSPLINAGVERATGKYIILTNPECLHLTDILSVLDEEFKKGDDAYIVCACQSVLDCNEPFENPETFQFKHQMWYQHTEHRDVRYHFCTAISKKNYQTIGGFDERYADGIDYDDDAFLRSVNQSHLKVIPRDDALVLHQEHRAIRHMLPRPTLRRLHQKNKRLFEGGA